MKFKVVLNDFSTQSGMLDVSMPIDWDQVTITVENGPLPLSSLSMMDNNADPFQIATVEYMTQSQCIDDLRIQFPIFWFDDDVDPSNTSKCYRETASSGFTVNRNRKWIVNCNKYHNLAILNTYTMASGDVLTVKQSGNSIFMSTSGGNESWNTAVGTIEGSDFVVVTDNGQTLSGQATPITGIDIPSFGLSKVDPTIQWSDGSISTSNTDTLVNTRACGSPSGTLSLSSWTDFGPCVEQTDGTWSKVRRRFCFENNAGNIELRCDEDCSGILPNGEAMSEIDSAACASITPTDTNQWTDVTVNSPFLLSSVDSNGEVQIKYFPDILNKADAVTRCAEEGGIIMPVETPEDLDLVMTTAEICDDKPVWMPMTDSTTENSFLVDVSS